VFAKRQHQPDVIFVANGSTCKLIPEGAEGAPDLLVEILSPSTSVRDPRVKSEFTNGVGGWL